MARAFRPPRSRTDSCPRPFSRKCRQARSGHSGQRNPSHDPRTLRFHDDGRQFAVCLWLLLLLPGTPVVWPASRVLQQWRNGRLGRKPGNYRRSDPDGFGTADICRSQRNNLERARAVERAATFASATNLSAASAADALSTHQSQRHLISTIL